MSVYIPRRASVGWAKESTPGTYVSPSLWSPHQSMGLKSVPEIVNDNSAIGVIEEAFDAEALFSHAEGPVEGMVYDDVIGLPLLSNFGSVDSEETADEGVYDHSFTVSQANTRPTLSLTEKTPNRDVNYTMAVVRELTITAEAKQFPRYSADIVSKPSVTNGSASTPAITVGNRLIPSGIALKIADDSFGFGAGTVIPLRTFTGTFNNGAEHDPDALGYDVPPGMVSKTFASSVAIECLYRDDTLRLLHLLATKKAMQIVMTNSAVTIGASSHPTLTLNFERGFFNPWSDSTDLDAIATQSTTFNTLYSTSESASVSAVLRNLETSY